jgi:hypothetical protein
MSVTPVVEAMAPQAWDAAWTQALEVLELDVTAAENLLAANRIGAPTTLTPSGEGWHAPFLEGPLPSNLRARSAAVLARQLRVSEELAHSMALNRRELRLAQRMDSGASNNATPAFIDSRF